jgi:hypothetical protein
MSPTLSKFWAWTDHDGDLSAVLTRDDLLDNLMLYWLPGTGEPDRTRAGADHDRHPPGSRLFGPVGT